MEEKMNRRDFPKASATAAASLTAGTNPSMPPVTGSGAELRTIQFNAPQASSGGSLMQALWKRRSSGADVGSISQNAYLFCAAKGLATVVRESFPEALSKVMKLRPDHKIILVQSVGYPK